MEKHVSEKFGSTNDVASCRVAAAAGPTCDKSEIDAGESHIYLAVGWRYRPATIFRAVCHTRLATVAEAVAATEAK